MKSFEMLLMLGCKPNNMGYRYLVDIVDMALNGREIFPLTAAGYRLVADKYSKSVNSIEKNIQNCISTACLNGDNELLYEFFGETISENKGKPTNKHFICSVVERLKMA